MLARRSASEHPPLRGPQLGMVAVTVEEVADLDADVRQQVEQLGVRLGHSGREELHDPADAARAGDRKAEACTEAALERSGPAREVGIDAEVGDPDRLAGGDDPAGHPDPGRQLHAERHLDERLVAVGEVVVPDAGREERSLVGVEQVHVAQWPPGEPADEVECPTEHLVNRAVRAGDGRDRLEQPGHRAPVTKLRRAPRRGIGSDSVGWSVLIVRGKICPPATVSATVVPLASAGPQARRRHPPI